MELNFTLITPKPNEKAVRTVKTREYSDEFIGQFVEVWGGLSVAPKGSVISVEFPNAQSRNEWFDMAKEYGKTFDTAVHVQRVKGTESMHPDHGKLTITMETVDEHTDRILKAKERVDTSDMRDWLNASGHPVKARGRVPANLVALYENRTTAL